MSAITESIDRPGDRYRSSGSAMDRTVTTAAAVSQSAVSWGAIFAGAAAAASLSLILLLLGTGLGLSSVSPWAAEGIDATTFGISSILWITFMQLAASGLGGYIAGRLRVRWSGLATDEVYFRDTAHGFLAWGVATLGTAALLTGAIGSIIGGGVQAGAAAAGSTASAAVSAAAGTAAQGADAGGGEAPTSYFVDSLFRSDVRGGDEPAESLAEVTRIFANAIRVGSMPDDDIEYVAEIVAERTDLTQAQAEQRVREVFANLQTTLSEAEAAVRDAADTAREASAYAALWLFISLLIGAFVASWMATFGGRQRDL